MGISTNLCESVCIFLLGVIHNEKLDESSANDLIHTCSVTHRFQYFFAGGFI